MEFVKIDKNEFRLLLSKIYLRDLNALIKYIVNHFSKEDIQALGLSDRKKISKLNKLSIMDLFFKMKESRYFERCFYTALAKSEASRYIYGELIWKAYPLDTQEVRKKTNKYFKEVEDENYYYEEYALEDEFSFVMRKIHYGYSSKHDILYLESEIRELLKLFFPVPNDYNLAVVENLVETTHHYSNEEGIFPFIHNIQELLDNNLIEFGKTNEKPMVKSLNLLKDSTKLEEFYQQKKIDNLALDMLTRSFYYYKSRFQFKAKELDSLMLFMEYQLKGAFSFTISRIFTSHLKKVRFGKYLNEEKELFDLLKYIIKMMPKDAWVAFDNILSHTYYRELYFDFEDRYRTENYEFTSDKEEKYGGNIINVGDHHGELFHEPVLKGVFFYMGALGLMELKYDDPISPHKEIRAKDKPYISVWDDLKYVKLTKLGEYVFGFRKAYTPKEIVVKKDDRVKFDEFKPMITVDKSNSIMVAKLEPFTEKIDANRYMLTHNKLFRECKHLKDLKLKIEGFYSKIEKNPPKVFIEFFDEAIANANLMKRNLKQVVIELESNKKLLNLFMRNKKLQELLIKAEGYRIIVFKEDIPKVTRIVKENGFFVEF